MTVSHQVEPSRSQPCSLPNTSCEQMGIGDVVGAADLEAGKTGRRDPDHFDRAEIQRERRADRRRVAAQLPLPETVAHDGAGNAAAGVIVGCREHTSEMRLDTQHLEELAADEESASRAGCRRRDRAEG